MRCSGEHHHFAPGSATCACGRTHSALASNLPYPSWVLDESSHRGTSHSNYANATDPRTGRTYVVREYLPETVSEPLAQRRRFIATAKALQSSPVRSQRLLFAYTRNGRGYTVAEPVLGAPFFALMPAGKTPEPVCLARLGDLLRALRELHAAGTSAGPLFHGDLGAENVVSGTDKGFDLLGSLYLENLLRENPLPPEHFQARDLLAAADLVHTLAGGPGVTSDQQLRPRDPQLQNPRLQDTRPDKITDPILGATLEFLYGVHGRRPNSAGAALDYLQLLQRAAAGRDRALFAQASILSPSPRLRPFMAPAPSSPAPPAPKPAAPPQPRPPQATPVAAPPPFVPYTPVATPPPTHTVPAARPAARPSAARRRRGGCGGCLFTVLLALLLIAGFATLLMKRPPGPTSLNFSAEPNPAVLRAGVQLQWTSSGFARLELDGRPVQANGSLLVVANGPHRYRLAGVRPDGSRVIRELQLNVLPRRVAKPSPGVLLAPPPQDAGKVSTEPTNAGPGTPAAQDDPASSALPAPRDYHIPDR